MSIPTRKLTKKKKSQGTDTAVADAYELSLAARTSFETFDCYADSQTTGEA